MQTYSLFPGNRKLDFQDAFSGWDFHCDFPEKYSITFLVLLLLFICWKYHVYVHNSHIDCRYHNSIFKCKIKPEHESLQSPNKAPRP